MRPVKHPVFRYAMPVLPLRKKGRRRAVFGLAAGLVVGLSGCGSSDSKPSVPVGGSGHLVEAREGEPFRHLVVEGTPYEMGWHQGRLLRNQIRERLGKLDWLASDGWDVYIAEFERLLPTSAREEIRGVAAGAGVKLDVVLRREIARDIARWSPSRGRPRTILAAFASAPGATATIAVARNERD